MRKPLNAIVIAGMAGSLIAQSTLAQAADNPPAPYTRVGPWVVDYDADFCRLIAVFAQGERRISLQLVQAGPSSTYEMLLSSPEIDVRRQSYTTRWDPAESTTHTNFFYGQADSGMRTVQLSTSLLDRPFEAPADPALDRAAAWRAYRTEQRAFARTVTSLTFEGGPRIGEHAITLVTGPMDRVLAALDTCGENLVQSWGFDPEQQLALRQGPEPIGNPGRWVTPDDYPPSAIQRGIGGLLKFRLSVEIDGSVSSCHIPRSLTDAEFSEVACNALSRRARFHPAIDASGKPVRALYLGTIRFQVG